MSDRKKGIRAKLKSHFSTGLLAIVPFILSLYILWWFFTQVDRIIGEPLSGYIGQYYYGVGFLLLVFLIWLIGLLTSSFVGRKLVNLNQRIVSRIPVLGTVFKTISQISHSVLDVNRDSFKEVVLLEVFGQGKYSLGFITNNEETAVKGNKEGMVHVFVPTAPNPTSGYLLLVEERRLTRLEIPIEEAFKAVVSAGMVVPAAYQ